MTSLYLLWVLAMYLRAAAAGSFFPCHGAKGSPHNEVQCASVKIPRSICSHCPLRETLNDGSFEQCDRIYDTSSSMCIGTLQQYVDDNPCDIRRASALTHLKDGDESARSELDYFLYSVCEQCCDCIPMGVEALDYTHLSQRHSTSSPSLWSERRGNCPAHATYDVCKIFPSIKSFGSFSNDVSICDQLTDWVRSEAAEDWQTNPEVVMNDDIQKFLRDVLVAIQCDEQSIWRKCQIMEDKQHHLGIPSGSESDNSASMDSVSQLTPAPIPEASDTSLDSISTDTNTAEDSEGIAEGENVANGSEEGSASVQSPSGAAIAEASNGSGSGAPISSTGGGRPGTIVGEESDISDGSESYTPPILQGIRSCFPGSSTVQRRDGALLTMEEVQVGDEILVSEGKYSPIYTFSHRSHDVYSEFVKILTKNHSLYLSSEHSLYVNGKMKNAGLVRKGEYVNGQYGGERVVQVDKELGWGLYNPHTINGEIVVDGILCSCFTGAIPAAAAQGLLSPFRAAFVIGAKHWIHGWLLRDGLHSLLFWNG